MTRKYNRRSARQERASIPAIGSADAESTTKFHRYSFARQFCFERCVLDIGAPNIGQNEISAVSSNFISRITIELRSGSEQFFDVVLVLDAVSEAQIVSKIAELASCLAPTGMLVLTSIRTGAEVVLQPALKTRFKYVTEFLQRTACGSIIMDTRFSGSRVIPVDNTMMTSSERLFLCSNSALPKPTGGLFESRLLGQEVHNTQLVVPPFSSLTRVQDLRAYEAVLDGVLSTPNIPTFGDNAAALAERLLSVEEETIDLRIEAQRLRKELSESGGGNSASIFFDVPRTKRAWPMVEFVDRNPDTFGAYDRRVDDDAIVESRLGASFLETFHLNDEDPRFAQAVADLNTQPKKLHLSCSEVDPEPDVSIIIPVYGQLSYTLNCLHSLFGHHSLYRAEIIIIDDMSPDPTSDFLPLVNGVFYRRQEVNQGFISSCNTGGAIARGRYVVMLNNDTRVVVGWLDELLRSFEIFPRAGIVGSKMLYPDGVLQEAGGILWRDGTAWNYGRNDDPNRPQYSYARQVDYVSGCSMAIPITLWRNLGGFDLDYRPAYCEDADLCLRTIARGQQVWFQPRSRVIHYEGQTSGTDVGKGIKAYQIINSKKLYRRWRENLLSHRPNGEAPYLERERSVRQRVLVIDATTPTPEQDAGSVTTTLVLRLFQQLEYKTHFVAEDNFLFTPQHTGELQRRGIECAYSPFDSDVESYLRLYGWSFDVIHVFRITVLEKVISLLRQYALQAPIIFNNMDLHYLRMEREAELSGSKLAMRAAAEMKTREVDMMQKVDCIITPSTFEEQILAKVIPSVPVRVLPFMMEFEGTHAGFSSRRDICFLGGYRHSPNVDAVVFFVREILPLLQIEIPEIRFIIAGAHPSDEVRALASDNIVITGLVPDLRDIFDAVRVFVCPLRFGAGVKGKVSAAMSYGLPVVSTLMGVEGVSLVDGEHVLLADAPSAFAQACLELYSNEDLWNRLSRSGMDLVKKNHSLEMGLRVMQEAIDTAVTQKLGLATPAMGQSTCYGNMSYGM